LGTAARADGDVREVVDVVLAEVAFDLGPEPVAEAPADGEQAREPGVGVKFAHGG